MWTNFVGSLSRSIYVTLGAPAFKTLVSTTKVLYPTLKKKRWKGNNLERFKSTIAIAGHSAVFPIYYSTFQAEATTGVKKQNYQKKKNTQFFVHFSTTAEKTAWKFNFLVVKRWKFPQLSKFFVNLLFFGHCSFSTPHK